MSENYLTSIRRQFLYYKNLGDKTLAQIKDDEINWQFNTDSNSIATIVKHMRGNMMSRWTDFLTSDGEKPWRERDAEFDNDIKDKKELLAKWEEGWSCLMKAINSLSPDQLEDIVYIRNEGHTVMEAINRQVAHYAYHVGQMVYVAKMIKSNEWKTLSIARNKSKEFNQDKFTIEKRRRHFTDE